MKSKKIFLILSLFCITLGDQAQVNYKDTANFREKIEALMAEYDVPALGIGIIENGEISYINVFGELQEGVPAPENTIFNSQNFLNCAFGKLEAYPTTFSAAS